MNVTQLHASEAHAAREAVAAEVRAELARQRETSNSLPRHIGKSQRYWYERINARLSFSIDDLAVLSAYLKVPMSQFVPSTIPAVPAPDGEPRASGGAAGIRTIYLVDGDVRTTGNDGESTAVELAPVIDFFTREQVSA